MGGSSDSGRPPYSYEEVKAILGNARFPRNPAEAQAFAIEDAYRLGKREGYAECLNDYNLSRKDFIKLPIEKRREILGKQITEMFNNISDEEKAEELHNLD